MYCKKLKDILSHKEAATKGINEVLVKQLDHFIRVHTTHASRKNINPVSFARKLGVDYEKSLYLFKIAKEVNLFEIVLFFNDPSNEQHRITSINEVVNNEEGESFLPAEYKDRINIYFKLVESPEICSETDYEDLSPVDIMLGEEEGKKSITINDAEGIIGEKDTDSLLFDRERKSFLDQFKSRESS